MKLIWLCIICLYVAGITAGQKKLPAKMFEKPIITYYQGGGKSRSYKKITITKDLLEFEELIGSQQTPVKWSSTISLADLKKLYSTFVENEFDTIKNDVRKRIVYDAGSETITISDGAGKFFGATYGANSPLLSPHLQHYQNVKKAIDDLVEKSRENQLKNSDGAIKTQEEFEKYIQGTWRVEGQNGGYGWYLQWTFDGGKFQQIGYPAIFQEGKYNITEFTGEKLKLELVEQKGTFGTANHSMEIVFDSREKSLTISGTKGFKRYLVKKTD